MKIYDTALKTIEICSDFLNLVIITVETKVSRSWREVTRKT